MMGGMPEPTTAPAGDAPAPGPVMPMRIGADRVTHGDSDDHVSVVRSPYDGREVGRVPAGTEADIDAAVAAALARHRAGPLEPYERAEILDRAAALLDEPAAHERFARLIAEEAA